ncbi:Diacylglycerol kinase theta [Stylophora pistillata]|uniref:diacylglycerol kinase (ATP) n=1 Tax=Stylophora pistillata TaxID=50429 RepID=A0A2B4RSB0_STYPI|nr:Diacylglycerol kinase theta [Stylophora pistillata]
MKLTRFYLQNFDWRHSRRNFLPLITSPNVDIVTLSRFYAFRSIPDFRVLICGGDGTVGWMLSCLEDVAQELKCKLPASAVLPLGTGNDLSRILHWGSGYSGGESPVSLLMAIDQAHEVFLDRWLHNKGVYFRAGIKKMVKGYSRIFTHEVEVEGQTQSGIRTGIRLAQGAQINIKKKSEMPVQIDGEPWMQPPGNVIVRPVLTQALPLEPLPCNLPFMTELYNEMLRHRGKAVVGLGEER